MKPKSPAPVASKAKPKLMFATQSTAKRFAVYNHRKPCESFAIAVGWGEPHPVLVLPQSSASSARARLRFERLTDEQKVEAMAKKLAASAYKCAMDEWVPGGCMNRPRKPNAADLKWYARHTRAILALVHGRGKK